MTLDEMKLAVCEKLPELIGKYSTGLAGCWLSNSEISELKMIPGDYVIAWRETTREINWSTEGLQVCHEAEKLLTHVERFNYEQQLSILVFPIHNGKWNEYEYQGPDWFLIHATCAHKVEALCRVWFPERFQ